jgi:hypothetical protein
MVCLSFVFFAVRNQWIIRERISRVRARVDCVESAFVARQHLKICGANLTLTNRPHKMFLASKVLPSAPDRSGSTTSFRAGR